MLVRWKDIIFIYVGICIGTMLVWLQLYQYEVHLCKTMKHADITTAIALPNGNLLTVSVW